MISVLKEIGDKLSPEQIDLLANATWNGIDAIKSKYDLPDEIYDVYGRAFVATDGQVWEED